MTNNQQLKAAMLKKDWSLWIGEETLHTPLGIHRVRVAAVAGA